MTRVSNFPDYGLLQLYPVSLSNPHFGQLLFMAEQGNWTIRTLNGPLHVLEGNTFIGVIAINANTGSDSTATTDAVKNGAAVWDFQLLNIAD